MKTTTYRLTDDRSGEACMIKSGKNGNLTVLSKVKDKDGNLINARRAIKHCPNQRSIFVDEQDDHALVKTIVFINGYLHVPEDQPLTKAFLDAHPSNSANGGVWFEEVNEEKEAKESLEMEDLVTELKYLVKQKSKEEDGIHELTAEASVIENNYESTSYMKTEELRRIINRKIDLDPYYFTDGNGNITIFEDDITKRKYITLRSLKEGILKKSFDGRSMLWGDNSEVIISCPVGKNLVDHFAEYLTTDDGILIGDEIAKKS